MICKSHKPIFYSHYNMKELIWCWNWEISFLELGLYLHFSHLMFLLFYLFFFFKWHHLFFWAIVVQFKFTFLSLVLLDHNGKYGKTVMHLTFILVVYAGIFYFFCNFWIFFLSIWAIRQICIQLSSHMSYVFSNASLLLS